MRRGGIPLDQLQKTNNYSQKKKTGPNLGKYAKDAEFPDQNLFAKNDDGNPYGTGAGNDDLNKSNALDTSSARLNAFDNNPVDMKKSVQMSVEDEDDPEHLRKSIGAFGTDYLDQDPNMRDSKMGGRRRSTKKKSKNGS